MWDGLTLSSPGCTHLCSSALLSHPPQCIVIPLACTFVFRDCLFMMAYPGNRGPAGTRRTVCWQRRLCCSTGSEESTYLHRRHWVKHAKVWRGEGHLTELGFSLHIACRKVTHWLWHNGAQAWMENAAPVTAGVQIRTNLHVDSTYWNGLYSIKSNNMHACMHMNTFNLKFQEEMYL